VQEFTFPYQAFRPEDWEHSLALVDENGIETMNGASCLFQWRQEYQEALSICHYDFYDLQRPHLLAIAACVVSLVDDLVDNPTNLDTVGCAVILEKSEKVRLVTPNEDTVAFVGSLFNSWLLGLLRQDPRVDPVEEPKQVHPMVETPVGYVIRSVDLVRASDQITGADHRGILRGLLIGLGIPVDCVFGRTLLFFARPVRVEGIDPRGVKFSFLTEGQPAMGRGPTWPVLSLYTLWCVIAAKPSWSRVVGDDAMFASTDLGSKEFNKRLTVHNGQVNNLKDVESFTGGTLVERLGLLDTNRRVEWHDTCSVAVLDGRPKVERGETRSMPRFLAGPSIPYAKGIEYICENTFSSEFAEFRKFGLDPFLPREFGGPGFPCSPKRRLVALRTLRPQWVRALRVIMSQGDGGIGLLLRLQGPYRSSKTTSASNLQDAVLAKILAEQEEGEGWAHWEARSTVGLTLDEFTREVESLLVSGKACWDGYSEKQVYMPTIRHVAEAVHREVRLINWTVPKHRLCDTVRKIEIGLDKFLLDMRLGMFRMPIRYRTTPKIGTTMGYWKGESNLPPSDQGELPCLDPFRGEAGFVAGDAYTGRGESMFSSGERNTGLLPRGTNMGLKPTFHKRFLFDD